MMIMMMMMIIIVIIIIIIINLTYKSIEILIYKSQQDAHVTEFILSDNCSIFVIQSNSCTIHTLKHTHFNI